MSTILVVPVCAQTYQPPVFTDVERQKRIEEVYPIIDKLYEDFAEKNRIPGLVYGLVVDGKLMYSKSLGFTDLSKKMPVTSQSLFRVASMSKSFTAMAILQLRDAGKLSLDDAAERYIPEMKNLKLLTTDAPSITLRHLLTHAAGFPEDNPWGDRQLDATNEELMAFVKNQISFSNAPGIEYEYSNLGFTLLGYIIEKVSGKTYQNYINENILTPLGMTHSAWEYTDIPAEQLAHGYRWIDNAWTEVPLLHDGAYGAMGGLISSLDDFSKYVALHMAAWPPRNEPDNGPLRRSSLREMHHPWNFSGSNPTYTFPDGRMCGITTAYAYGLSWLRDCDGREFVGHSGGLPGFGSNWRFLPEYGIGIISFANRTYAPTTPINLQVLDTLIRKANLTPRQLPASVILKQRQQELTRLLPAWTNAEASGLFAENFFDDYALAALQQEAKRMFEKAGKIIKVHEIIPENQLRGSYLLEGEKSNLRVSFTLTPENQPLIQEYRLREVEK
ncbi:serine hydrolase domain-containing protein [Arundinibacter roseus]|uniref:Class A beta-lactamase-related serine hydrolase n=1 Tax=Arundinibacter roseus TaxID=2070510 RepID=A0A4R4KCL6_9BACT|nr:serine hydrolase domain-containing protein [Arundinibacter roseus]TDB64221.1 class A beta-lactamase-related serine hydrolase [Arundinibacter roseus]